MFWKARLAVWEFSNQGLGFKNAMVVLLLVGGAIARWALKLGAEHVNLVLTCMVLRKIYLLVL